MRRDLWGLVVALALPALLIGAALAACALWQIQQPCTHVLTDITGIQHYHGHVLQCFDGDVVKVVR